MNAQKKQIGSNSRFVAMAEVGSKGEWRLITGKLKGNSWDDGKFQDRTVVLVTQL